MSEIIRIKLRSPGGVTFTDEIDSEMLAYYLIGVYNAGGTLLEIEVPLEIERD